MTASKIDIVLPNRIGDAILTLPSLVCLKQLRGKYGGFDSEYKLITHLPLEEILQALNLFKVSRMTLGEKINSWLTPSDKAFFLVTTSRNLGYHSRLSHGLSLPNKKLVRYSKNLAYLNYPYPEDALPKALVEFLKSRFGFACSTIRHFGICLESGYTVEQIRQTFRFDKTSLSPAGDFFDWKPPVPSHYLVFCMEAASGSKRKQNADRRWQEEYFFDLAETAFKKYSLQAAFIGISNVPELPDKPYFIDFRQKHSLKQTALLLHYSGGYVGNDTGPLHLSNLMKKNAIGIYMREDDLLNNSPIFPQLTTKFLKPVSSEEIYPALGKLVSLSL